MFIINSQGHWQTFEIPEMRSHKVLYLQGGSARTGEPILTNGIFHAIPIIFSLKLGDHEDLAVFVHGSF